MASGGGLVVLGVVFSGNMFWAHANDWMSENIKSRQHVFKLLKHIVERCGVVEFIEYNGFNLHNRFTRGHNSIPNRITYECKGFAICYPNIVVE